MTCIWIYDDCGKPCVGAYESIQRALLLFFGFGFFSPLSLLYCFLHAAALARSGYPTSLLLNIGISTTLFLPSFVLVAYLNLLNGSALLSYAKVLPLNTQSFCS
jgi:hypothetical protein